MSCGRALGRLRSHKKSNKKKTELWTHFSLFQVWDNIRDDEIGEIEGLFRHIYRCDPTANSLNVQKKFGKLGKLHKDDFEAWTEGN